jgi:tetratricopeptide (TPR) repeat protein
MRVFVRMWRARLLLAAALCVAQGAAAQASRPAAEAVLRGQAAEDAGDYDKAIREFSEAVRLDPACGRCFFYRALAYKYNKRDFGNAVADYTESLRLSHKSYVEYKGRGECHIAIGNYAMAVSDFESYLRFEPGDPDAKRKLADAQKRAYGDGGGGSGGTSRFADPRDGKSY